MALNFKAIFSPVEKPYRAPLSGLGSFVKDSFTLSTLLLLGGLGQGLLALILPARYALLPLLFLLLRTAILTARNIASPAEYASKLGVIPGRTSAQLPNASYDPLRSEKASPFGSTPADKKIVVFHLGARFNHPLGPLAAGNKEFGQQFEACHKDMLQQAKKYGCLGGTTFHGADAVSNNTIMTVYYFRDLEGLNQFAHDSVHRQAWDWYNKVFTKKWGYSHVGIFHEAFCVPAGAYETIYLNMQPVLMGAASADVQNEATGDDEWVRTLVDASSNVWRSQHSRMGREVKGQAEEI